MVPLIAFAVGVMLIASAGRALASPWLARQRRDARRRRLRAVREYRLDRAGCTRDRHELLIAVVDRLDEVAPVDVDRFDLDALVGCYVDLVIKRRRIADQLLRTPRVPRGDAGAVRADVHQRQVAWRATTARVLFAIDDELASIEGLVRLYCARGILREQDVDEHGDGPLTRVLEIADADDALAVS
jgi:hypothetical protein